MNARLILLCILGLLFSVACPVRAADRSCPTCYPALDQKQAQAELQRLKEHPITSTKDLLAPSSHIRRVDVINVPSTDANGVPASGRPTGSLQLDKVVIIDPSPR